VQYLYSSAAVKEYEFPASIVDKATTIAAAVCLIFLLA